MSTWIEVADGVHQRRYNPVDISVVVIAGGDELLVVDTRNNPAEGAELITDIRTRFDAPIRYVVNTHAHYDHTFGNQVFGPGSDLDVPILGHARIQEHYRRYEAPRLARVKADPAAEPDKSWAAVELTPPTRAIEEPTTLSVGGRQVRLLPQPPGHTDTDLVLHVPDVDVWVVGDLVEESGPPMFGSGSYPLGWPLVLFELLDAIGPTARIVPGHGQVVDRQFVLEQAEMLTHVADLIRQAWHAGMTIEEALASDLSWPLPGEVLRSALRQGFEALAEQD